MACLAFAIVCGLDGKAVGKQAAWKDSVWRKLAALSCEV
jgi:hypothetical protein